MSDAVREVLIVGGSLGGLSVAENLRLSGYSGTITIVGAEHELPYDRPPLSKEGLSDDSFEHDVTLFHPQSWYDEQSIEMVLGDPAASFQADRQLTLESGRTLRGEHVVLATGLSARSLAAVPLGPSVFEVRTRADAQRLSGRLGGRPGSIVVLGAGFIGLEVAGAAVTRGWQVTVLERGPSPLGRVLPEELAQLCWRSYEEAGVALSCGSTVMDSAPVGDSRIAVVTDSGDKFEADIVVAALGAVPNTGWLDGSGIATGDGILCDDLGRTNLPGVWAVGDVARWHNHFVGRPHRVEQWESAREHAAIVARQIAGRDCEGLAAPPYFWSDLLGGRVQFLGAYDDDVDDVWVRVDAKGRAIALVGSKGVLRGIFSSRFPRATARGRDLLTHGVPFAAAQDWASELMPV